jgi:hypothetical protein
MIALNSKGIEYYSTEIGSSVKIQSLDRNGGNAGYYLLAKYGK